MSNITDIDKNFEVETNIKQEGIKYYNPEIKNVYKQIEATAEQRLLNLLPEDMREDIRRIIELKNYK